MDNIIESILKIVGSVIVASSVSTGVKAELNQHTYQLPIDSTIYIQFLK